MVSYVAECRIDGRLSHGCELSQFPTVNVLWLMDECDHRRPTAGSTFQLDFSALPGHRPKIRNK